MTKSTLSGLVLVWLVMGFTIGQPEVNAQIWYSEQLDHASNVIMSPHSLGTDAQGRVHAAYGGSALVYAIRDESGWMMEVVDDASLRYEDVLLSIDPDGYPHVIASTSAGQTWIWYYKNCTGWHSETIPFNKIYSISGFQIDTNYKLHLCFHIYRHSDHTFILSYGWRDMAGWHQDIVTDEGWPYASASLALTSGNTPIIADLFRSDEMGYSIRLFSKLETGWMETSVTDQQDGLSNPVLQLDDEDNPFILCGFDHGGLLMYFQSEQTWIQETLETNDVVTQTWTMTRDYTNTFRIGYFTGSASPVKNLNIGSFAFGTYTMETVLSLDTSSTLSMAPTLQNEPIILLLDHEINALKLLSIFDDICETEIIQRYGWTGRHLAGVIDSSDRIHAVYSTDSGTTMRYAILTESGWRMRVIEEGMNKDSGGYSLVIDSQDRLHLSYYHADADSIRYRMKENDVWTTWDIPVTSRVFSTAVAVDSGGVVRIACQDGGLHVFKQTDSGWEKETLAESEMAGSIDMKITSSGKVWIGVYRQGQSDCYRVQVYSSSEEVWHHETVWGCSTQAGTVSLALDSDDRLHIAQTFSQYGSGTVPEHRWSVCYTSGVSPDWQSDILSPRNTGDTCSLVLQNGTPHILASANVARFFTLQSNQWYESWFPSIEGYGACQVLLDSRGNLHTLIGSSQTGIFHVKETAPADGIRLDMPAETFRAFNYAYLNAWLFNSTSESFSASLFVLLQAGNDFFFYPGWSNAPDNLNLIVPVGRSLTSILPIFMFPPGIPDLPGLIFYGALVDTGTDELIGGFDGVGVWSFDITGS